MILQLAILGLLASASASPHIHHVAVRTDSGLELQIKIKAADPGEKPLSLLSHAKGCRMFDLPAHCLEMARYMIVIAHL